MRWMPHCLHRELKHPVFPDLLFGCTKLQTEQLWWRGNIWVFVSKGIYNTPRFSRRSYPSLVHTTMPQIYSTHNSYQRSEEEGEEEDDDDEEEEEGEEDEGDEICVIVRRHTRHVQWGTSHLKRLPCATANIQISSKCPRTYCELFFICCVTLLTSSVTNLGPQHLRQKKPRFHLFNALAKGCVTLQLSVILWSHRTTRFRPCISLFKTVEAAARNRQTNTSWEYINNIHNNNNK